MRDLHRTIYSFFEMGEKKTLENPLDAPLEQRYVVWRLAWLGSLVNLQQCTSSSDSFFFLYLPRCINPTCSKPCHSAAAPY